MKRVINVPPLLSIILFFVANAINTVSVMLPGLSETVRIILTTVAATLHGINTALLNNKYHMYKSLSAQTVQSGDARPGEAFDNFEELHANSAPPNRDVENPVEINFPYVPETLEPMPSHNFVSA